MVCTVLTGILEIATLEKTWPPTWKAAIGSVLLRIARVGLLNVVNPKYGWQHRKLKPATKANCMIVKVTGYRYALRMTLPVLDDMADEVYHSEHSRTNRIEDQDQGEEADEGSNGDKVDNDSLLEEVDAEEEEELNEVVVGSARRTER